MLHSASEASEASGFFLPQSAATGPLLIISTLVFLLVVLRWLLTLCARSLHPGIVSSRLDNVVDELEDELPQVMGSDFIEEELESYGVGWFQYKVLIATWLGWMADGAEGEVLGYLVPLLMKGWGLHEDDVGYLSSLSSGAMALSAMVSGRLADSYGRRPVFTISCCIIALGSIGSALTPSWKLMVMMRVFGNFGVGALLCVDVPLMSEFMPKSRRNSFLSILHFGFSAGMLWVRLAAWICFGSGANIHWRVFVLICAVPVVLAFLSRRQLPETPHALLKMGREQEARVVLAKIAKVNGVSRAGSAAEAREIGRDRRENDNIELSDLSFSQACEPAIDSLDNKPESDRLASHSSSDATSIEPNGTLGNDPADERLAIRDDSASVSASVSASPKVTTSPRGYWRRMLCISLLTFSMQFGCAMTLWVSEIVESLGARNSGFYATMTIGALVVQFVHILSYFLFSTTISPWDVLFFGNAGCFSLLVGMAKILQGDPIQMLMAAVLLVLWNIPFSLAWGALYCAIVSDAPSEKRATTVGLADAASRLSAVLHPIISEKILVSNGPALTCSIFAQGWLLATCLTLYLKVYRNYNEGKETQKATIECDSCDKS